MLPEAREASLDGGDVWPLVAFSALDEALVELAAVQSVLQRALVAILQHQPRLEQQGAVATEILANLQHQQLAVSNT